jgi:hypothetical protein
MVSFGAAPGPPGTGPPGGEAEEGWAAASIEGSYD